MHRAIDQRLCHEQAPAVPLLRVAICGNIANDEVAPVMGPQGPHRCNVATVFPTIIPAVDSHYPRNSTGPYGQRAFCDGVPRGRPTVRFLGNILLKTLLMAVIGFSRVP
ncbi:hypothetical protein M0802_010346 [Mischocyttarus mexicanus]|nr:hypothetical protein M0802_010346 [Mischocyttarus mexicanus]